MLLVFQKIRFNLIHEDARMRWCTYIVVVVVVHASGAANLILISVPEIFYFTSLLNSK